MTYNLTFNTFPLLKKLVQVVLHEVVAIRTHQSYIVKPCFPPIRIDVQNSWNYQQY